MKRVKYILLKNNNEINISTKMLDCLSFFIWSANFGLAASKECLTITAVVSQLQRWPGGGSKAR